MWSSRPKSLGKLQSHRTRDGAADKILGCASSGGADRLVIRGNAPISLEHVFLSFQEQRISLVFVQPTARGIRQTYLTLRLAYEGAGGFLR